MQVSSANDVKTYSLTAGKSLPDWIEDRAKRRKKSDAPGYSSSAIQLIQDFDMPVISNRVSISRDERYIITGCGYPRAAGTWPTSGTPAAMAPTCIGSTWTR